MKTKKCAHCLEVKEINQFHSKGKEGRYNSWCKDCVYVSQCQRWIDRKLKAIELLGGECQKCGYNKNYAALSFHHIDPSIKEYNWSKLKLRSWKDIIKELKKCILLCNNCHAEVHNPNSFLDSNIETDNNFLNLNHKIMKSTGVCPNCNTETFGTKFCSVKCASLFSRKVKNRPSKIELKDKIENMSWVNIGKEYGVSDNAVRKWAKGYKLI